MESPARVMNHGRSKPMRKTAIKNDIVERDSPIRGRMRFLDKTTIEIDRELSDLDHLALDFVKILKKHTPYVIVSGYVSILLGRARASEDIDIIISKNSFPILKKLVHDLQEHGFYCINEQKGKDIFECLAEGNAVRFARKDTVIPNIEMKWAKTTADNIALQKSLTVLLPKEKFLISPLELQIAFKETVLKSPKDNEDARHLRKIAKEYLDASLLQRYKELVRDIH
jgi:hypothetical protein